jgi:uncharacterized protein (TIGR04222 family)
MIVAIANPFDMMGPQFLSFYMYTAALVLVVAAALRWQARCGSHGNVDADLCPYEVAYLRESPALAVRAAVANLISKKALELDAGGAVSRTGIASHAHPLEEAILLTTATPTTLRTLERRVSPNLDRIRDRLEELGLLVGGPQRNLARVGELLVWATMAVGAFKIVVGIGRGKPVGFLILLVIATFALRLIINNVLKLHRTRAGEQAIARMQQRYRRESARELATTDGSHAPHPADAAPAGFAYGYDPFTMMIALYGMQMLAYHPTLSPMQTMLTPPPPESSGWSSDTGGSSCSSSGDSGGSCSSGCGGCGGGD